MKTRIKVFYIFLCFCFSSSYGVEIQQGGEYTSGTKVESSMAGLSFTIPEGWQGQWPTGSEMFVLGSTQLQAYIFVYVDQMTETAIPQEMNQVIPLDSGIALAPTTKPQKKGNTWQADYKVNGSPRPMSAHIQTRLGEHGVGAAFMAVSDLNTKQAVKQVVANLVMQSQFKIPQQMAQPPGSQTQGNQNWQDYMKGRYIVFYYTGSGYHEEDHIWLCSDGSFYRSGSAGGFGNNASGAFANKSQGRWKALGQQPNSGTLVLAYGDGSRFEGSASGFDWSEQSAGGGNTQFTLSLRNDKFYVNNSRWFRDTNQRCQ